MAPLHKVGEGKVGVTMKGGDYFKYFFLKGQLFKGLQVGYHLRKYHPCFTVSTRLDESHMNSCSEQAKRCSPLQYGKIDNFNHIFYNTFVSAITGPCFKKN